MRNGSIAALLGLTLGLGAATAAVATAPVSPFDQVVRSERAFAAQALTDGLGPSFVAWAAPDGIVMTPDPANAREVYGAKPAKPGAPPLKWWPAHAGVARSGDLAFDTGPWVYGADQAHGWFVTIWKRQPNGGWQWVLDHGMDSPPSQVGADGRVTQLKAVDPGPLDPAHAFGQVKAEEAALGAETAKGNLAAAYRKRLGGGVWVAGLEPEPQMSANDEISPAVIAALAARPQTLATEPLGGGASQAGDLAYTYGKARWTAGGKPVEGRYVRVWQRQHGDWRIVLDEITPN